MLNKVVIPVAGLGTRVLPASKSIPKEMLTVVDKPVIQHVVEEAIAAGMTQIILVTRSGKSALEDHFDRNAELEQVLEAKGKDKLLASIKDMLPRGVQLISVRQDEARGLGHAVLCAAELTGADDFAVMLPDMLIDNSDDTRDFAAMVDAYRQHGRGQVMVEQVPADQVERYGIVDCGGQTPAVREHAPMQDVVEKPPLAEAPSNLAIVGRYILPGKIMQLLQSTPPGAGNEIQLTDAIKTLLDEGGALDAFTMGGDLYDCGNKAGLLKANVAFGLKHPETSEELSAFLQGLSVK
ncbi:UTP--glucose-1-phosphate uridylyltransferase [Marinobacterium sp. AK62]|uniref:UTP--glucose-1-phosphate uridylyltransferase n=1 Tax=Marinobacterium alkalitolerans TaxID=1542925 RepID=A0ABS3ZER3_9GAMM|nr:UTP--glucose-1-phosphate uridylyltransferase [Marinobacterium alkalitolerans]MBP0050195.1 UTP--glucose-1-phosphate uridylyltransferase [Marinobacterium alkalitolerans]